MRKYVLFAALLAASACAVSAYPVRIEIPEISRYYSDYNYVVAYSTPAERSLLARRAAGAKLDGLLPDDSRVRTLFEMVKSLLARELDQDSAIVRGNRLAGDFLYAKIPLAVSAPARDRMVVQTIRQPARRAGQTPGHLLPDVERPRFDPRQSGFAYEETDYWVRSGGTWRISSLHFYLIGP